MQIERFSLYREPAILTGPEHLRRSFGNLFLRNTNAFATYAAEFYEPMQGASGMLSTVQRADGKFQMMFLRNKLGLTDDQKARVKSDKSPSNACTEEPTFWVHFIKDVHDIDITQSRPVDDESVCSDDDEKADVDIPSEIPSKDDDKTATTKDSDVDKTDKSDGPPPQDPYHGAADDAF